MDDPWASERPCQNEYSGPSRNALGVREDLRVALLYCANQHGFGGAAASLVCPLPWQAVGLSNGHQCQQATLVVVVREPVNAAQALARNDIALPSI